MSAPRDPSAPAPAFLTPEPAPARAWVVFCGEAELWWLKCLRPGFRHCFALLNDGRNWVTLDPLSSHTEVAVQPVPADFDLPAWFRERGHAVAAARLRRGHARPAPFAPFTCVEAVKRVLGLHAPLVLTPRQLHRRLTRSSPSHPETCHPET
jgi:hypothetical protein